MRMRSVGVLLATCGAVLAAAAIAAGGTGAAQASASTAATAREPIDLLYISDSSGWGVAKFYGREIGKALGVRVRVHDEWRGDLSAVRILRSLRSPLDLEGWILLVRQAEVIVVYGNWIGLSRPAGGNCITDLPKPPQPRAREWAGYVGGLKAIYKRIFAIRKGKPVILRTANWYVPVIAKAPASPPQISWEEAGLVDECTKEFEAWAGAIARAARAYRVPVADVYSNFNGTTHLEDPVAKGYIQTDGIHPSNKGRMVIARTLADLGYRKVSPPR